MVEICNYLFGFHFQLCACVCASLLLRYLSSRGWLRVAAKCELRINYLLLALCLLAPLISNFTARSFHPEPIVKIDAALGYRDFEIQARTHSSQPVFEVGESALSVPALSIFRGVLALVAASLLMGLVRLIRDLSRMKTILQNSVVIRSLGRVRIAVSEQVTVPFSAWAVTAWIVLPISMVTENPSRMRMAIAHEIQHQRNRDTIWIYFVQLAKAVGGLNPLLWIWERLITESQEMACDQSLLEQRKIKRPEYARLLVEIAETAVNEKSQLVCATGLAFLADRQTLSRRIESMFKDRNNSSSLAVMIGGTLALLIAVTAVASGRVVDDKRVTLAEAQKMAVVAQGDSAFPIVVNDLVLNELNRFLGTNQGRTYVREALTRMETYRPAIESKLGQYDVPSEIMAVPIFESGYKNLPQGTGSNLSAGLWQFIPSTAEKFGLHVGSTVDDRLNADLETDAALRYLKINALRFKDWQLSIMAYNMGESAVQAAIEKTGTRDAWSLIRAGYEGDKGYLAKFMAAVLIMRNPEYLK
jgi:beta-lactamase regulating signal transducer with metallopeptidase domain